MKNVGGKGKRWMPREQAHTSSTSHVRLVSFSFEDTEKIELRERS